MENLKLYYLIGHGMSKGCKEGWRDEKTRINDEKECGGMNEHGMRRVG